MWSRHHSFHVIHVILIIMFVYMSLSAYFICLSNVGFVHIDFYFLDRLILHLLICFVCLLFSNWTTVIRHLFGIAFLMFKNYNIWFWFPFFIWINFIVLICESYCILTCPFSARSGIFLCFYHTQRKCLFWLWYPIFVSSF